MIPHARVDLQDLMLYHKTVMAPGAARPRAGGARRRIYGTSVTRAVARYAPQANRAR